MDIAPKLRLAILNGIEDFTRLPACVLIGVEKFREFLHLIHKMTHWLFVTAPGNTLDIIKLSETWLEVWMQILQLEMAFSVLQARSEEHADGLHN